MILERYSNLEGKHALFTPSQPFWLRYDDEKLLQVYRNKKAAEKGTQLHDFARRAIELGIRLPNTPDTINQYVNDAIDLGMQCEVTLYYSDLFFGTADAIKYDDNKLWIFDLKTGIGPVHDEQPLVYAALFCLQYMIHPKDIVTELRIYQNNEKKVSQPEPEEVEQVMNVIRHHDSLIQQFEMEGF